MRHALVHGAYSATVAEWGARLASLEHDGRPLIEPLPAHGADDRYRGAVLAPWPNRVVDARWEHAGQVLHLPVTEPERGHAHHGLVASAPWRTERLDAAAVTLAHELTATPGYPWALALSIRYALDGDGLTVRLEIEHRSGAGPAPVAVGFHPYLTAGSDTIDDDELSMPGRTRLLVDDRMAPVGREPVGGTAYDLTRGRRLGGLHLDDAFTDLGPGPVRLRGADGVTELWAEESLGWLQAFTHPDRRTVAVEPMSAPPDALNSGDGLRHVAPGEPLAWTWGLRRG